ncbi:SMI1/KNR4 family protein [Streptomyces sp. NPDC021140]|uniref:SMI1/KNR4 family protein n=2 Tax=unclassified Streptomyces TaxID=2593676 RepID=UPI0037B8CFCD
MSDRSLSPTWLAAWTGRVSKPLRAMTDGFERRHGFPPGANEVRPPVPADRTAARTLARLGIAPADLVTFYDSVGEIAWEDVGNGYFVDSAADVLLRFQQYGTVDVGADQNNGGLVIGSNGGGLSYVASPDGAIHRTRTTTLDEPELDRVADDLRQFLETLEQSLTRFATTDEPGFL